MSQILSIQSSVAYGFAGNSAAVFAIRRFGMDVWPVMTVNFSNHTGYGAWRGTQMTAEEVLDIVQGIDERGVLPHVDAVLTGYLGRPEITSAAVQAAQLLKQRNPQALFMCDPVMGSADTGCFVDPAVPGMIRQVVAPNADIMSPNLFELGFLTDMPVDTMAHTMAAIDKLRSTGPRTVLVTSANVADADRAMNRMIAVNDEGAWQVETPDLGRPFTGSGDITAAMFLAHLLRGDDLATTLGRTASIVYSVLRRTAELNSAELALVQAQDEFENPAHHFEAVAMA